MNQNQPDSNSVHWKNPRTWGAIAVVIFIVWAIIYNIGKPWNCQQASDDLADRQAWAEKAMQSGNTSAYMGALSDVDKAKANQSRLCK